MINLRPENVVTFPIVPADHAAALAGQLRNIFSSIAVRFGTDKARELFTQAACAEIARQSDQTGNLIASRFAVELLLNQAFERLPDAIPVGYAG